MKKAELEKQIEEIKQTIERFENKIPLSDNREDIEYAGNPHYTIGWIKAIAHRIKV